MFGLPYETELIAIVIGLTASLVGGIFGGIAPWW